MISLTPSQLKAEQEFKKFFNDPTQTCICLSGKPGVGKTYFINEVVKKLVKLGNRVVVTATTNKAAILLKGITIHSALGVKVSQNEATKTYKLNTKNLKPIHNSVIIIDESSMLEKAMLDVILNNCINCKIIFVGDKDQLPAIKQPAKVFDLYPVIELTDIVRQKKQDLIDTIEEARQAIYAEELILPDASPNVHIISSDKELHDVIKSFGSEDKILSYTNDEVIKFNKLYRDLHGLDKEFKVGDVIVAKNYAETPGRNKSSVFAEEEALIEYISKPHNLVLPEGKTKFMVKDVKLYGKPCMFYTPEDTQEYLKYLKKLWEGKSDYYFFFRENIADLRDIFSCTVHAAQGSTYNKVLINLDDIVKPRRGVSLITKAKLLYVALSRAKEEIYIYTKEYA